MLGEKGSLFQTARALMQLQSMFGDVGVVKGRGPGAAAVKDMLLRMRKERGPSLPPSGIPPHPCWETALTAPQQASPLLKNVASSLAQPPLSSHDLAMLWRLCFWLSRT